MVKSLHARKLLGGGDKHKGGLSESLRGTCAKPYTVLCDIIPGGTHSQLRALITNDA